MTSYADVIDHIFITREAVESEAVQRFLKKNIPVKTITIKNKEDIPKNHQNQRTLLVVMEKGKSVGRCPGSKGHVCCNYITLDMYMGCSLGCSYCIMKHYLNYSPILVNVDTAGGLEQIRSIALKNPGHMLRIGSGELGDSLLFDPLFELSREYIEGLADLENVYFESKTKTGLVDHLLKIKKKGNAVIGFSVNPPEVIAQEEGIAVPLDDRLRAAERAFREGYALAFHLDPVFYFPGWEDRYARLVQKIVRFPSDKIRWVSMGTVRYTPGLKERIDERPYLFDEFVPGLDGKYRYIQKKRSEMYRFLKDELRKGSDAPVYMCMESPAVWRNVYGALPHAIPALRGIFKQINMKD